MQPRDVRGRDAAIALALLFVVALLLAGGGSSNASPALSSGLRSSSRSDGGTSALPIAAAAAAAAAAAGASAASAGGFRFMSASQLDAAGAGALTFSVPPWVWLAPSGGSGSAVGVARLGGAAPTPTTAEVAATAAALEDPSNFKAQSGEDRFALAHFFAGRRGGLILESGALDGVAFSTSWLFERALGWRAVHVEASPRMFADLVRNRPGALNIHAALCGEPRTLHLAFVDHTDAVGGLWEFMSPRHRAEFWPGTDVDKLPRVACMPLAPLLALFGIVHVDLWVLDVEGAELEVLMATDFARLSVDVIVVETIGFAPEQDARVVAYIEAQGFVNFGVDHHNTWLVAPEVAARTLPRRESRR